MHALRGNAERWDQWPEIRRCNPLTAISPKFRRKLLEERDAARADSRLEARFLSYRLNVPSGDESTMLLTVDDWDRVKARPVPERAGKPIVGIDLGAGRAWSAAARGRAAARSDRPVCYRASLQASLQASKQAFKQAFDLGDAIRQAAHIAIKAANVPMQAPQE